MGTQPAVGDIKRLLANLIGVAAMEEILQKAGMPCFIATAVNDAELFSAHRGCIWGSVEEPRFQKDRWLSHSTSYPDHGASPSHNEAKRDSDS